MSERDPGKGPGSEGYEAFGGPEGDALIGETEKERAEHSASSKLFDIRFLIGGLFVLYGAIVLIVGLVEGIPEKYAANEININIWTGSVMLVVGALFLVWGYFGRDALGRNRADRAALAQRVEEHEQRAGEA